MSDARAAKVRALVTLANDKGATEGEASNAARAACKLIVELGLLGGAASGGAQVSELEKTIAAQRRAGVDLEMRLAMAQQDNLALRQQIAALRAELEKAKSSAWTTTNKGDLEMDSWVSIENKYRSNCRGCFRPILVGERVMWKRGKGVAHEECVAKVK